MGAPGMPEAGRGAEEGGRGAGYWEEPPLFLPTPPFMALSGAE